MLSSDTSAGGAGDLSGLREQLNNDPGNPGLQAKYFWTLHQQLKACLEAGEIDQGSSLVVEMGNFLPPSDKAANATGWAVHRILKTIKDDPRKAVLDDAAIAALIESYHKVLALTPAPDKMHSAMLWISTQMQAEEGSPWYVPLVRAVGMDRLQPEDFEGKEVNGYPLPSLAERIVMAAAKQVEVTREQDDIDWLMPTIERLLERKPQNIWLKYHRARLLIATHHVPEARASVLPVVTAKRTEFWAWAILGETYLEEDPDKAVTCLCKTVTLKEDEVFLLSVREQLAHALAVRERFDEARGEVDRIIAVRKAKGARIPERILALTLQAWYLQATAADNTALYLCEARSADDLLFQDAHPFIGLVTNIDEKSRSCFVTFRLDGSARYRYHRTPWEKQLPTPGTFVLIRVRELDPEGGKRFEAVSMQPTTELPDASFAREFAGELKLIEKPGKDRIGFVNDVFLPGALIKAGNYGSRSRVRGIAVKEMNRAKGEYGWRAVHAEDAPVEQEAMPMEPMVERSESISALAQMGNPSLSSLTSVPQVPLAAPEEQHVPATSMVETKEPPLL